MKALLPLSVCLLVLSPAVGSAQTEPAPEAPEAAQAPVPQGELLPESGEMREDVPNRVVPRLLLSSTLGSVAGLGGGIAGLILGGVIMDCDILFGGCDDNTLALTTLTGVWGLSSLTAYGLGSALDGRGLLSTTLIGGAAGLVLGLLPQFPTGAEAWYLVPVGAALGAAIAYEYSHSAQLSAPPQAVRAQEGAQVMFVAGRTAKGGILGGLMGRF